MSSADMSIILMHAFVTVVCAPKDAPEADVIRFAEAKYPCGTDAGWMPNPEAPTRACDDNHPDTHQHWLLEA